MIQKSCCSYDNMIIASPRCSDLVELEACSSKNFPISNLQERSGAVWRSDSNVATINIDLGCSKPLNSFVLANGNFSCDAVWRIRGANNKQALTNPFINLELPNTCGDMFIGGNVIPLSENNNRIKKIDVESYNNALQYDEFDTGCNDCDELALGLVSEKTFDKPESLKWLKGQEDKETEYYDSGVYYVRDDCDDDCFTGCDYKSTAFHFISRCNIPNLKYWQIDIYDPENDYIEASRIILDEAFQPECNIDNGWSLELKDDNKCTVGCSIPYRELTGNLSELGCDNFSKSFQRARDGLKQDYFLSISPTLCGCDEYSNIYGRFSDYPKYTNTKYGGFSKSFKFKEII